MRSPPSGVESMLGRNDSSFSCYSNDTNHKSSTCSSPASTECDADDERKSDDCMSQSGDDMSLSAPVHLSVSIPSSHSSLYLRKPTLREILSNKAPPPWTLTALMAYLSNNHCLEVLEFTMDAGRYKKHYVRMMHRAMERSAPPLEKDVSNTSILWQRLVEAYIMPSGSREINIPSEVRDPLLSVDLSIGPPAPDILDKAVAKVYELMEDSVLVPFLESLTPSGTPKDSAYEAARQQDCASTPVPGSTVEPSFRDSHGSRFFRSSARSSFLSSNPRSSVVSTSTTSTSSSRRSPPETFSAVFSRHRFLGSPTNATSTTPSSANPHVPSPPGVSTTGSDGPLGPPGLSDDSTETNSVSGDSPLTPGVASPQSPFRHSGGANWRRLGRWSAWKGNSNKQHRLSHDCRDQTEIL